MVEHSNEIHLGKIEFIFYFFFIHNMGEECGPGYREWFDSGGFFQYLS